MGFGTSEYADVDANRGVKITKFPSETEVEFELLAQFWVGMYIFTFEKKNSVAFWENLGFFQRVLLWRGVGLVVVRMDF